MTFRRCCQVVHIHLVNIKAVGVLGSVEESGCYNIKGVGRVKGSKRRFCGIINRLIDLMSAWQQVVWG